MMMDSNGQLHDDKDIQQFLVNCDLADLHQKDPAPLTYIGFSHSRLLPTNSYISFSQRVPFLY
jgi:hypothetical protein